MVIAYCCAAPEYPQTSHFPFPLPPTPPPCPQIASLKRLGRGTRIMLLDRYGSTAKTVAKELARRGFGRVFVVSGGFDGRGGWVQSKLLVKPTAGMYSGDVSSKLARTLSTRNVTAAGRKALPAPSK